MKVVVVGANGFLGRHTLIRALSYGWHVIGVVRGNEAATVVRNLGGEPRIHKKIEYNALVKDFRDASAILSLRGIAAGTSEEFEQINVRDTRIIAQAANNASNGRFVAVSGLGCDLVGKISWATNDYFRSKLKMEEAVKAEAKRNVIFRPSYILGPGDELIPGVVSGLTQGSIDIIGSGKIPFQPVYVGNAVEAFLRAATGTGSDNITYDLVGPETTNMESIIELIAEILRNHVPIGNVKRRYIPFAEAHLSLGIPKTLIDVMQCDVLADHRVVGNALNIKFLPLRQTLDHAIAEEMNR
ncbi:MAG TPA: NAD-dependent epimerase/dehydratase family protein, partial [Candidatus Hodarchaeales archaeon]|nr:NAD-dependent epimerase/dehydratase family protein [Candidatus Hodarchaeales archaeon]